MFRNTLTKKELKEEFFKLPLDTKHFSKEAKLKILSHFDNLDQELDGWLIHSENYQALNTILPKFQDKIQAVYIDPPFNLGSNADFLYNVDYKDSSWITLLENRISLAKDLINDEGSIFVRCDHNGNMYVRLLLNHIFGEGNFRNEFVVRRGASKEGLLTQFESIKTLGIVIDNIYWFSKNESHKFNYEGFLIKLEEKRESYWSPFTKIWDRKNLQYEIKGVKINKGAWMWRKERTFKAIKNYEEYLEENKKKKISIEDYWKNSGREKEFVKKENGKIRYWVKPKNQRLLDNNWSDIPGYSSTTNFSTENSEILLKRIIDFSSSKKGFVLDFFLGSGTTIAVAHKLKRKWVGIEMGEHFNTVVMKRMKKVLAGESKGISKDVNWKGGGFFKYYQLEQYEQTLKKSVYKESHPLKSSKMMRNIRNTFF